MSRGAGSVEQALRHLFERAIAEGERWQFWATADLCQRVFGNSEVTKAQRVSVLRAMKKLGVPDDSAARMAAEMEGKPPPRSSEWRIMRSPNRRGWFVRPPDAEAAEDGAARKRRERLVAIMERSRSDFAGERDAVITAANRMLEESGLRWDDVIPARLPGRR